MTTTRRHMLCALAAVGVAAAQDAAGDRVTVPLTDPSRPLQLHASLLNGSITVRGTQASNVTVESTAGGDGDSRRDRVPRRAEGLRRIDVGGLGAFTVEERDNVVRVSSGPGHGKTSLLVQVPTNTSVRLRVVNGGDIAVERVNGEIDVNNVNGKVTITNVSGTVVAHSLNDDVVVTMDRVTPDKPMSFTTLNGDIDVTLPASVKAKFKLKSDDGDVFSDFDMRLEATTQQVPEERRADGRYRVKIERSVSASVNGGGPEYQFTTLNGKIMIRKR